MPIIRPRVVPTLVVVVVAAIACSNDEKPSDAPGTGTGGTAVAGAAAGTSAGRSAASGTGALGGTDAAGATSAGTGEAGAAGTGASGMGGATTGGSGGAQPGTGGSSAGSGGSSAPTDSMRSAGCAASATVASGRFDIDVDGTAREYILALPTDYDPGHAYPLIVAWHGRMYSADWVANGDPPQTGPYFGIQSEANGGAIFVAPQALSSSWTNQDGRDVAFVDAMRARLTSELCIDEGRIFSVGFSFGAIMTLAIGCEEGDVFRAIAPMSGSLMNGCPAADQPVAYWGSHGNVDTTIRPAQGEAARDEFLMRNHCGTDTVPVDPSGCVSYQGCDSGYPVVWCPFDGAHEPPQFAGSAIWSFLSAL